MTALEGDAKRGRSEGANFGGKANRNRFGMVSPLGIVREGLSSRTKLRFSSRWIDRTSGPTAKSAARYATHGKSGPFIPCSPGGQSIKC